MKQHTLRIYKSRKVAGQWGWTLIAPNGKKVATCGELYKSKAHAQKMADSMSDRFYNPVLKVEEKRVRKADKWVPRRGDAVVITGKSKIGVERHLIGSVQAITRTFSDAEHSIGNWVYPRSSYRKATPSEIKAAKKKA